MIPINLKYFRYEFNKGPLSLNELKKESFGEGNCRLAIQYYFFKIHGQYFKPNQILNPKAYLKVGKFVVSENEFDKKSLQNLREGDVIYARRKDAIEEPDREAWIISLHTAVYVGNNKIYHCALLEGKSAIWTINKLLKYYKIVAVKRIL